MTSASSVDKILDQNAQRIEKIRQIFGAPSFAIGVIRNGQRSFRAFGLANNETGREPDENTIYGVGSCTKAFTSTVLARLAQDGALDLDAPVSAQIPELKTPSSPLVGEKMTVRDMTSHCVGLNQLIYQVIGRGGNIFTKHDDIVRIFNSLPKVAEFRTEWQYNNWLFALAGVLITKLSGVSFGTSVNHEVFSKLAMDRSYFTYPPDDNFAPPYLIFDDGPPQPNPLPSLGDGDAFDSSGSMRSCVKDMLTWADALMKVWRDSNTEQSWTSWLLSFFVSSGKMQTPSLPPELHKALAIIQEPYFPLAKDPKQKYAMGLFTYNLPTPEINTVTNAELKDSPYVLGHDSGPKVVIGHIGNYGGYLSVYWTFPEEDTAIVVLCNTYDINGDPTNIVAQEIAQELFDMNPRVDMVEVTKNVVEKARKRWTRVHDDWSSHRVLGTRPADLSTYIGTYVHLGLATELSVCVLERGEGEKALLRMTINSLPDQEFILYHYHQNSWTFLPDTRDSCIANGYAAYIYSWDCFVIDFDNIVDGLFREARWKLDGDPRVQQTSFMRK